MPGDLLTDVAADERRQRGAEVDAHVVDGVATVAPRIVCGVERTDDRRDVRLEETVPGDQKAKRKGKAGGFLDCHHQVPGGNERPAKYRASPFPKKATGKKPADETVRVHQCCVRAVNAVS